MIKHQQKTYMKSKIARKHNGYEEMVHQLDVRTFEMSKNHLIEVAKSVFFTVDFSNKSASVDELMTGLKDVSPKSAEVLSLFELSQRKPVYADEEVDMTQSLWGKVAVFTDSYLHKQFRGIGFDKRTIKSFERALVIDKSEFLVVLPNEFETGEELLNEESEVKMKEVYLELGFIEVNKEGKTYFVRKLEPEPEKKVR